VGVAGRTERVHLLEAENRDAVDKGRPGAGVRDVLYEGRRRLVTKGKSPRACDVRVKDGKADVARREKSPSVEPRRRVRDVQKSECEKTTEMQNKVVVQKKVETCCGWSRKH
jgi:hypothetical protein